MLGEIPSESDMILKWQEEYPLSGDLRLQTYHRAESLVEDLRRGKTRSDMSGFAGKILNHYHLGGAQALALMELAEAYPRTPDSATKEALLKDKIIPQIWLDNPLKDWLRYDMILPVKGVAYGLMLMQKLLQRGDSSNAYLQRGNEYISKLLAKACHAGLQLGAGQFVVAEMIEKAYFQCDKQQGRFSFDMLGEAARTEKEALRHFSDYKQAIEYVGLRSVEDGHCFGAPHQNKHGVSVKLSSLYGRYDLLHSDDVLAVLLPRLLELVELCKSYNIGITIDAEEVSRLELSLQLIEKILATGICRHWQGLSVVVQAYNKRAEQVIDRLCEWTQTYNSLLAVRLVKGAYWDTEIKEAQSKGLPDFHTYSVKTNTDIAYVCLAHKLLQSTPVIYPQFATHNAYTAAAIAVMVEQYDLPPAFEFQRIHGMGEILHKRLEQLFGHPSRVYAPVGQYHDLLPYLIRRLLENSSASSFVHQCADSTVPVRELIADPLHVIQTRNEDTHEDIKPGTDIFLPTRKNSSAPDLHEMKDLDTLLKDCKKFMKVKWGEENKTGAITNPCNDKDIVGFVKWDDGKTLSSIMTQAKKSQKAWEELSIAKRAGVLDKIANAYEGAFSELVVLLMREAGKNLQDATDEIREAVDFCRYYSASMKHFPKTSKARGVVLSISPWNFPLAIFTGQVVAGLVAGNAVLAKPAEQTPLVAMRATELMHEAGVPKGLLHCLYLSGEDTSSHIIRKGLADMVVFTGSNKTAKIIEAGIIKSPKPATPLVAETGGVNAMVVDSTALLEQAVDSVIESAFRSAGQRCSALRVLYVQEDIYKPFIEMLTGAMDLLKIGNSCLHDTDIGALIDKEAYDSYHSYLGGLKKKDILHRLELDKDLGKGYYVSPVLVGCSGIEAVREEVFAPILHIASFRAEQLGKVIDSINGSGYGLTFGVHSRLEGRLRELSDKIRVGNIYINRNQIGAVVGSQPFGGCGLSGTGPKAGGELYLSAFCVTERDYTVGRHDCAGITGEENFYYLSYRPVMLCGKNKSGIIKVAKDLVAMGCRVSIYHSDISSSDFDGDISGLSFHGFYDSSALQLAESIIWAGAGSDKGFLQLRSDLHSVREDIVPLSINLDLLSVLYSERHICRDLTAIGGNLGLLV